MRDNVELKVKNYEIHFFFRLKALGEHTKARRKVLGLAYVKLMRSGRWVGIRTGAGVTAKLV